MSRNLVLVRAGDQSLHPEWLTSVHRNFDLAVSYFGDEPDRFRTEADVYARFKGGKWNGVARFFEEHPALLDSYDYVWLPDDDISASADAIEAVFHLAQRHGLDVCQPTLTADSYYSYLETLHLPGFEVRFSNMVEIMAPCLSTAHLRKFLPLMAGSMSGFGLDMVWGRLEASAARRCAFLDSVQVRHTRPVGSALRPAMARANQDPSREQETLLNAFACAPIAPTIHAARLSDQREICGPGRIGLMMAYGYWRQRGSFIQPLRRKYLRRLLLRHCLHHEASLRPVAFRTSPAGAN
jgi:hypothetical protein